jgi:hypothetical protein
MNASRIRGFLIQQPKPHLVRVSSGDSEPQELKPGRSYAKTAESIDALGCELVECLDSDGKLLRALRLGDVESTRSDAAAIPVGLASDPHALMLTHFANLLHRAYEHSTEIAFAKLVDLVERIGDRAESIEQRLERSEAANRRLAQEQVEDAIDRAQEAAAKGDGGTDMLQQMAGAFLSGRAQTAVAKAPLNGKGGG